MEELINEQHKKLIKHPLYQSLNSLEDIRIFMSYHIFAVWDFMSLLKNLQSKITCVSVPWKPSTYSASVVRMINEIVLCEESDLDHQGNPCSHFELYLRAMEEIGANTSLFNDFIGSMDTKLIPNGARQFVEYNLDLAHNGRLEEVAAAFFYGREKLLPDVFTQIIKVIKGNGINCPTLTYYFERHIEVDGDSHGPLAKLLLSEICSNNDIKILKAQYSGIQSLRIRHHLWDAAYLSIISGKISASTSTAH